jgi:hypothetical protein
MVQGIDLLGRGRSGGEVTAQGVVGGVLSELGAHGGRGGVLGGRGVAGSSHCEVGASEGSAGAAITHWGLVLAAVVEVKGERREYWQGLGFLLSPSMPN